MVGINEYYTSQKCPDCHNFIARVTIRQLYCKQCCHYHHRDVMAAENMAMIVRERLSTQTRPLHLQPVTEDGRHPWMSEPTEQQGGTNTSRNKRRATNANKRTKTQMSSTTKGQGKRSSGTASRSAATAKVGVNGATSSSISGRPRTPEGQQVSGDMVAAVDTPYSSSEMSSSRLSTGPSKSRKRRSSVDLNQGSTKMVKEL